MKRKPDAVRHLWRAKYGSNDSSDFTCYDEHFLICGIGLGLPAVIEPITRRRM